MGGLILTAGSQVNGGDDPTNESGGATGPGGGASELVDLSSTEMLTPELRWEDLGKD
jgi:hypothetical protein